MNCIQDLPAVVYTDVYNYWLRIERNEYNNLWELMYQNEGANEYLFCIRRYDFDEVLNLTFERLKDLMVKGIADY